MVWQSAAQVFGFLPHLFFWDGEKTKWENEEPANMMYNGQGVGWPRGQHFLCAPWLAGLCVCVGFVAYSLGKYPISLLFLRLHKYLKSSFRIL